MTIRSKLINRLMGLTLCICMVLSFLPSNMLVANAADDLTFTIDTGASVTLKDTNSDGYYEIGNADELYAFAVAVNGGYYRINAEVICDITMNQNVLAKDGKLNAGTFRVWNPIGQKAPYYLGIFDGGEHTISGLYFNDDSVSYIGFFSGVGEGGTVKSVRIEDSYFGGEDYVGGMVAENATGTVTNCYISACISGKWYVGGVVGKNYGTVNNCSNNGTVQGTANTGGVVGYHWYAEAVISDCSNSGAVTGTKQVGGVVGYSIASISDCSNGGTIIGTQDIGGVAGYSNSTVTGCSNSGIVRGTTNVGGVVGYSTNNVSTCYNSSIVTGSECVGGVAGYSGNKTTNCYSTGTISGTYYVGGIVGDNKYGSIAYCYSSASINGTYYVGGIVGRSTGDPFKCYYLTGSAKDSDNVAQFGIGTGVQGSSTADKAERTIPVTAQQLTSGELAYLLQSSVAAVDGVIPQIWGQDLDNGKPVQSSPSFTGQTVYYGYLTCADDAMVYSNTLISEEKPAHSGEIAYTPNEDGTTHTGTYSCCAAVVTEEHTFEGKEYKCVCGKVETCAITLQYPTLLLEDEIKMNVYFTVNQEISLEKMGMLTWTYNPSKVDISTAEAIIPGATFDAEKGFYGVTTMGIPAQDLGDIIYFCIYAELDDGTIVYGKQVQYSPTTYTYNQLNGNADTATKALYVAILNYGAAAQTFLNDTDPLINANLSDAQKALVAPFQADMVHSVPMPSASKQGALVGNGGFARKNPTITLNEAFSINYYFTPIYNVIGNMTFYYWNSADFAKADVLRIDNATGSVLMTNENGTYSAAIEGIAAKDVDGALYACGVYTDVYGNTYSTGILPYSLGFYCGNQVITGTEAIKPLAAAIAVYGYYAAAYFA